MADSESPLIKTLPPATDYLTYLAIVEYNLSKDNLSILNEVLQDETLTTNIGWDLIAILLPFLPEAEECLRTVARLGNPREAILKVTESLRLIEYDDTLDDDDMEESLKGDEGPAPSSATIKDQDPDEHPTQQGLPEPPLPHSIQRFKSLVETLATLHRRIKTKYPSRFLSTSLQAVLASFSHSISHRDELVMSITQMVKKIRHITRPGLPSRQSSSNVISKMTKSDHTGVDPEASKEHDTIADNSQERELQLKLFQSFITHVAEEYLLNLSDSSDMPGMAWCSRLMEQIQPQRTISESSSVTIRFDNDPMRQRHSEIVGTLLSVSKDLNLSELDLLVGALTIDKQPVQEQDEDDPPNSASEIPLSRLGSMFLFVAKKVARTLYGSGGSEEAEAFAIFPHHHELMKNCLASPDQGAGHLGSEPATLIDAVLALGILALEDNSIGTPDSDEEFNEYLQTIALLSSNCPNPNLRGHAHYITTTVLRSHPDDEVRLAFIRDTLEHCPFENLKVSAVSWIKGAIIEANPPTPAEQESSSSIFAKAQTLDSLAPFLFPSIHVDLITAELHEAWITWQTNLSFYLACLNFLYLLLCAQHLHEHLGIQDLWTNNDVAGSFMQPLRDACARFGKELEDGGGLHDEESEAVKVELSLVENTLGRVTSAVKMLNESSRTTPAS